MAEVHPTCCDCDACLNGLAGLRIPGAGAVFATRMKLGGKWLPAPITVELVESDTSLGFSPELGTVQGE